MKKLFLGLFPLFLLLFISTPLLTQHHERLLSAERFDLQDQSSFISHLPFSNIGPTVFSGRVVDIAVNPDDPTTFYVAYASGGLWKTTNNGTSFKPIFDHEAVMTIGAIAVNWEENIIWIGTGEVNSSRSSYAGVGVYKSIDDGETWEYLGLPDSHHIGKIILHPEDANIAWIGVLGHLYSFNDARGVYKTTDGGESWRHTLKIDDKTGIVDMIMSPGEPDTLYAAAWERLRTAWDFTESGTGSGIYKSSDGGVTWNLLNTPSSGFPTGEGVGRIGLAAAKSNEGIRMYALLDNYFRRTEDEKEIEGLTKASFKEMDPTNLKELSDKDLEAFLRDNNFPKKYKAAEVKKMVEEGKIVPADLAYFLEDANSLLFDTPVIGAELYRSDDGGSTWVRTHEDYLDGVYFSYGYYFGVISADPSNADNVYIAGVPILASADGGISFTSINGDNVHVDHHKIWVNPKKAGHLILGNDGGINISYDNGESWIKCNTPAVGQFYYINVDLEKPYNVYGGTQDNGVWKGSHQYNGGTRWHNTGQYPYEGLLGGDGMQVQIDTRDNATVYTGFQFGNYFRIDTKNGTRSRITPIHELGERPYRWNWQSPIHLSIHHQDILYFGANVLFRSLDQGDNFTALSDDLTKGGKVGDVPYGTLSTIHESPLSFGMLYTGSDDGKVFMTPDGGVSWEDISAGLPEDLWVARVQASQHHKDRVFVALNGYRKDDFTAYVYVSNDRGKHWQNIGAGLPHEPVNVIKEDLRVEEMIFVGTDRGTYVSMDLGTSYSRFSDGLTSAPVHDIAIQDEAEDLLIGTHGRSIYRASISELRKVALMPEPVLSLFEIPDKRYRSNVGNRRAFYLPYITNDIKMGAFSPEAMSYTLSIRTEKDRLIYEKVIDLPAGLSYIEYDLSMDDDKTEGYKEDLGDKAKSVKKADNGIYYIIPGMYKADLHNGEKKASVQFKLTER